MATNQPSEKQKKLAGVAFILIGFFFVLLGLEVTPIELQESEAPGWVISIAGVIFSLAGLMILKGEQSKNINLYAGIMIALMGTVGAWVSLFGADENISGGFSFVSSETNYSFARILFGIGALICYATAIHAIKKHFRELKRD